MTVRRGDRVYADDGSGRWWYYRDLDWYAGATSGLDYDEHRLLAEINDGKLLVRHVRDGQVIATWFTLDELNHVDGLWHDGDVVLHWCEVLDRRLDARQAR